MSGTAPIFPAFIKLEYQKGTATAQFMEDMERAFKSVKRDASEFSKEAGRSLDAALAVRNGGVSINLGVPQLREAAAVQRARAVAARELATATIAAARAEGSFSQETRLSIAAAKALAREEEFAAQAALRRADAAARVEVELRKQVAANDNVMGAILRANTASQAAVTASGQQRFGLQQLGMQLNDIATMWALGAKPQQIFASQSGQVIQAIQLMAGGTSGLAGFLGGPWGIALTTATVALTPLVAKLFESADAAEAAKFSSYALSDAQGILGNVLDLTTGKINVQSDALRALAKAQLIAGRLQAQARQAEARSALTKAATPTTRIVGGFGGGLSFQRGRDVQGDIASAFLDKSLNTQDAVAGLESLRKTGYLTEQQFLALAQSVTTFGVEAENLKVFGEAEKLLAGTGGKSLLKPSTARAKRTSRGGENEAKRIAEFGERATEKITRLREQFDETPKAIDKAGQATRQLDAIIDDLREKKPLGFEKLIADAEKAKIVISEAMGRPFREYVSDQGRSVSVQRLILAGREDEAAALKEIYGLQRDQGLVTREQREAILANVKAERELNEQLERRQELISAYSSSLAGIRGDLEGLLGGSLSGGDFLKNLKRNFQQLQGKLLTEQLFGGMLRDIEEQIRKATGVQSSVDIMKEGMEESGRIAKNLGISLEELSRIVNGTAAALSPTGGTAAATTVWPPAVAPGTSFAQAFAPFVASNDNSASLSANGEIVVNGKRTEENTRKTASETGKVASGLGGISPEAYATLIGKAITAPLAGALQSLGVNLSGTLGGIVGGNAVGGIPGAIAGGLRGFMFDYGKDIFGEKVGDAIMGKLDGALKGSATGTQIGGLMKMLGVKSSTTGAQIGGAIGGMIPIPGLDIVGSIVGGLVGGMLKKTKKGIATIGGTGSEAPVSLSGNSSSRKKAAGGAADSASDAIQQIADALGAEVDYSAGKVSIGVRDKKWRVDTSGQGKTKKKNGAVDFGDDQEAAIAFAVQDLIKDGVIKGIRQSTLNILKAGKDLQKAIQDAIAFENVFKELRAYKDPVGAAIDELNAEFEKLITIFKVAGATAEEYAQLEELYGIKRAEAIKRATDAATSSLQDLYDFLSTGDTGRSLRDRSQALGSRYQELKKRVEAGDATAFDEYAQVSREYLDVQRQLYGSQTEYFQTLDEMTVVTKQALDQQKRLADAAKNADSPFSGSTVPAQDNTKVVQAVDKLGDQIGTQVAFKIDATNQNLGQVIAQQKITNNLLSQRRAAGNGSF